MKPPEHSAGERCPLTSASQNNVTTSFINSSNSHQNCREVFWVATNGADSNSSYDTFGNRQPSPHCSVSKKMHFRNSCEWLLYFGSSGNSDNNSNRNNRRLMAVALTSLLVLLMGIFSGVLALGVVRMPFTSRHHHGRSPFADNSHKISDKNLPDAPREGSSVAAWRWDHNAYYYHQSISHNHYGSASISTHTVPTPIDGVMDATGYVDEKQPQQKQQQRTLLILIREEPSTSELSSQKRISEITSRPNRAYARAWGRDMATYSGSRYPTGASLLYHTYQRQKLHLQKQQMRAAAKYSTVLLLPSDALVTDLDYDLLELLPADRLAAVAAESSSLLVASSMVLFNLDHPDAENVLQSWEQAENPHSKNHSRSEKVLAGVVEDLYSQDGITTKKKDMLQYLSIRPDGLVVTTSSSINTNANAAPATGGERVVVKLNSNNPDIQDTAMIWALESMADSVCFRYFPKCDLL